jgi:hypothetical protein
MDVFWAVWQPSPALLSVTPADYHRPGFSGRGTQGAVMDAAAWAGRKSEKAAPRASLRGVWGILQASPPRWNRLEPFHLAYAEHRADACSQCCYVNLAETCDVRTLCQRGYPAGNSPEMNGCGMWWRGARALPETTVFRAWQAADARLGGRVGELGIMQPSDGVTGARTR